MNLKKYITQLPRGEAKLFSKAIGVSPSYLSQMASGVASISPAISLAIERATAGAVTRADLRPDDYWLIWPDLPAPAKEEA